MRSQNSGVSNSINTNGSIKINNKIHNMIDKKTIGTASMRQRPTQQGGISQFGVNQSATLQNMRPFLTPDSTQYAQQQQNYQIANQSSQIQQSPQATINLNSLSFLVKPGFQQNQQSSLQNNRVANNSCMNIPTTSLMNSMMNDNPSYINLFDTSQINNHNKQQSFGSSSNLQLSGHPQLQQQNIFQQFKNNYLKQPTTPQVNQNTANQEKRFSEQLHNENSIKMIQFTQQQYTQESQNQASPQLSLIQTLTQKSLAPNQSSTRVNQKMRKTNSMSMIRLRQSQDSFFDTILNEDSHSNQGRNMVQSKNKKKGKKFGIGGCAVSPTSTAASALSQLISSQTNRMKSIPSPQPSNSYLLNKTDTHKQYQTSTSLQNDFSPQFFSKLKKKKMLFYQQNSKVQQSKIESKQDMKEQYQKQQQQQQQPKQQQIHHVHSSYDNSPNYQLWLIQQQQQQQVQNNNLPASSPTLKNTASTLSQQSLTSGVQQPYNQLPSQIIHSMNSYSLEHNPNSTNLKSGSNTSKTHSLLDKLNKLHKYSQQNINVKSPTSFKYSSQENFAPNQQKISSEQAAQQKNLLIKEQQINLDVPCIPMVEVDNQKSNNLFRKFQDLLGEQSCKNSTSQQSPYHMSDQISQIELQQNDHVIESELTKSKSQLLTQKLIQAANQIQDIPLPSQTLKNNQYEQYEQILEEYKKLHSQSDLNLQQFMDYLIIFAKKYIKPIPQIVKNTQQISSQYKKKDEEVNKLKSEKLSLLVERNKQNQQKKQQQQYTSFEKQMPQFIQIQHNQQLQQQTLKELHTPSTQIEETNQQGLIVDQQAQIMILKKQLENKNNQLNNLIERENITIEYLQQLQKLGYLPASSSFCSDSSDRGQNHIPNLIDDKNSGVDFSNHNTPHQTNCSENSALRNINTLSLSQQQQVLQSSEKEYQVSSNLMTLPSKDNDKESLQMQYQQLYTRLQKIVPFQNQNRETFLSEPSILVGQNKEKNQQQHEISQQFNQWLKFISNKKKTHYLQKSCFNQMSSQNNINSPVDSYCTTMNHNNNNQPSYINPDFSMNLDQSHHTQLCNSTSERNTITTSQIKGQAYVHNSENQEISEDRKVKDKSVNVLNLLENAQKQQKNQSLIHHNGGVSSDNTLHSQVDIAFQNKSTQGNINQTTSLSNDVEITSFQYLKNTPLIQGEQAPLEEYKKKNSKLSSVCSSSRNSFTSKSSYLDDDLNKLDIQNQIVSAQQELQQRYTQTMIIKSKSSSNLNDNIRQKLKLDLSVLKSPSSNTNLNNQSKGLGLQLHLGALKEQQQDNQNNQLDQQPVMDYYDEFMSKIDEFSLSWRKAVIDESQKYQNRDNPFKKQQLMKQHQQLQQSNNNIN